ncbi:GGDEF domain-containing protein [Cohnella pontilimi]|uniref:GGDEF domain-containing protein n=1 Tax=Cohnella pontilimi TaxID=2564100 RepID=A0A4U0FA74_9BACL|nr:GGDEF domain-containing protein [Cohnella pontilimi]TJY41034.1 GGDEF domain-containing protein [Cohnella pontilimi]
MSSPMENHQKRWNRRLLHTFWVVWVVSIVIECLYMLFVTAVPPDEFVGPYLLRPTALLLLVVLLADAGIRMLPKHHDYLLITASALFTLIVTAVHSTLDYLLFFLFFPVMVSILYFRYSILVYAISTAAFDLYTLYFINPNIHSRISTIEIVTMTVILGVYSGIAFFVLARGRELLQNLISSYESNQALQLRNMEMFKLAKTDYLTETYNHMAYHELVDKLVEEAEKGRLLLHLAVFDIDNFKSINDTYGHRAGDQVLRKVAEVARSKVGSHDFVARYGGEEFVILFTDLDFLAAYDTMEQIRRSIASTPHESLSGRSVTVSAGINRYVNGMGKEKFFQGADAALYDAKHSGKNRTSVSA